MSIIQRFSEFGFLWEQWKLPHHGVSNEFVAKGSLTCQNLQSTVHYCFQLNCNDFHEITISIDNWNFIDIGNWVSLTTTIWCIVDFVQCSRHLIIVFEIEFYFGITSFLPLVVYLSSLHHSLLELRDNHNQKTFNRWKNFDRGQFYSDAMIIVSTICGKTNDFNLLNIF